MIRATLTNAYRKRFPHHAAITRRDEAERARKAATAKRDQERKAALEKLPQLRLSIAKERAGA